MTSERAKKYSDIGNKNRTEWFSKKENIEKVKKWTKTSLINLWKNENHRKKMSEILKKNRHNESVLFRSMRRICNFCGKEYGPNDLDGLSENWTRKKFNKTYFCSGKCRSLAKKDKSFTEWGKYMQNIKNKEKL